MLYSYDVFDTLITRTTATPLGIFAIIQDLVREHYPQINDKLLDDFYKVRTSCEKFARDNFCAKGCEDISLSDIYYHIGKYSNLSENEQKILMNLELDAEYDNTVAIWENINEALCHLKNNNKVILISDMYLSSEQIRKLLMKFSSLFKDIPIYVSSECKVTKSTGNLYYYIRRQEQVEWREWIHKGDNSLSDYRKPLELGIKAERYAYEQLFPCEEYVINYNNVNSVAQLFVGASRNYRLTFGNQIPKQLGSVYGAGILLGYTSWILCNLFQQEISDLYFVARDGYILFKIAEMLNEKYNYFFNLKYIYGSRHAWKILALGTDEIYDVEEFLKTEVNYNKTSLCRIANALGIEKEDIYIALDISESIYEYEKVYYWSMLKENPFSNLNENRVLRLLLKKKYREKVDLTDGYIRQEIDITNSNIGFIEVHGTGNTQKFFCDYIYKKYGVKSTSFYYILDKFHDNEDMPFFSYKTDNTRTECVIEILTRALHGRTVGYQYTDKIEPVLKDDENTMLETNYNYADYINAVLDTIQLFITALNGKDFTKDIKIIEKIYYDYITTKENDSIFDYICSLPMSNSLHGLNTLCDFAPIILDCDIDKVAEMGLLEYSGCCIEFSRRRSSFDESFYEMIKERARMYNSCEYMITLNKIKKNIIIYGAGKVGQDIYNILSERKNINIMAWMDKKFVHKDGIKDSLENIELYNYDQIIVAVKSQYIAMDIMTDLIKAGVDKEKIYWEEYLARV